jgi:parallel beta-helix repeat protein
VTDCHVSNFDIGVVLDSSNGNMLRGNTADNNQFVGFLLSASSNNVLTQDSGTGDGLTTGGAAFQLLFSSNNNSVAQSVANGNHEGFFLGNSSGNTLTENTANNNGPAGGGGFVLQNSSNNVLKQNSACGNVIADASQFALPGGTSTGNVFSENIFCITRGI